MSANPKILCVDCDGTLIKTDLLVEALSRVLLRNPFRIFHILLWMFQGRQVLKSRISAIATLDPAVLPYREDFLDFLRSKRDAGWKIFMATAAHESHAAAVCRHLGIFDGFFASNPSVNLKGTAKEELLVREFGKGGFDYAGDADCDLVVWGSAGVAIPVGRSAEFVRKVASVNPKVEPFGQAESGWHRWLHLVRFHQWAKNLIIFVPLVTSHQILNPAHLLSSVAAFVSLGLVASATYVVNDLFDLDHDRIHGTKKNRPLASGAVGIPSGVAIAVLLFAAGISIAAFLPPGYWLCLAVYVATTLAYSFCLKKIGIVDAIVLAGLYTLRLLIGHAVTGVPISVWLLAFSIFLFFSLALVKRFVEIGELAASPFRPTAVQGRGYCAEDYSLVGALGVSCGVLSVLVLILYVNSPEVRILYSSPILLMLLAPIFLYWIGRVWLLAARGRMNEDPVLFALRDKASYAVGLATLLVIFLASGGK